MKCKIVCAFLLWQLWLPSLAFASDDWEKAALRLSGESEGVYRDSVKRLKAVPHLDEKLLAVLGENSTRTFLALDVISTLKRETLLPAVIKASEKDPSGFFYLAINTFIDGSHIKLISTLYLDRLKNHSTAAPAKMILLDTLARLRVKVKQSDLKRFLEDAREPEVQNAARYYVRKLGVQP